jgi:hypothetical protein
MKRLFLIFGLTFASLASAQNYSISSYAIDAGGGTSSGGEFSVSGSIGQIDAGTMSGGEFSMQGGFWDEVIVLPPTLVPGIEIRRSGSTVIISWPASARGFGLEATVGLSSPSWSAVTQTPQEIDGRMVLQLNASGAARFYRLRSQ